MKLPVLSVFCYEVISCKTKLQDCDVSFITIHCTYAKYVAADQIITEATMFQAIYLIIEHTESLVKGLVTNACIFQHLIITV